MNISFAWLLGHRPRRIIIGCGACIVLIPAFALYLLLQPEPSVNRQDYGRVAFAFDKSLVGNNVTLAKSLTATTQWKRIDVWMNKHQAFSCPFSLDFDDDFWTGGGSDYRNHESLKANFHAHYHCYKRSYVFDADDILLEYTEAGWLVADWSKACAVRGWLDKDAIVCDQK